MARDKYDIILVNLIKDEPKMWTKQVRDDIQNNLQKWFADVVAASANHKNFSARCWWKNNALLVEKDELVVYFHPEAGFGKIQQGTCHHASGCTNQQPAGMISEVYVRPNARHPQRGLLLAIVAFHELMHNKLDTEQNSVITDLHSHFNGKSYQKASKHSVGAGDTPSKEEKELIGQHLGRPIKQFTGDLMRKKKPLF